MTPAKAPCLSILGTGSDVGKSIIVTALCRIFKNQGIRVAPFKAQNMSNNSFVTPEGDEMGRAQVVQAEASGIDPHSDMNPVLLKPNSDMGAQIVLQGKVIGSQTARDYYMHTDGLFQKSLESLNRLRDEYDLIIMEGAGSCGEVNLRKKDFVNFKMAHAANAPVILAGDIDKGGIFAQLIGTLAVIPPEDQKRVHGFLINKFRGDSSLFQEGIEYIEKQTQLPVYGMIPYYHDIEIDAEDSVLLDSLIDPIAMPDKNTIHVAVIRLPHISNFTDFLSLQRNSSVTVHYLASPRKLEGYDAVILPGTKNVRYDLQWLVESQWKSILQTYRNQRGQLIGICGGYQMLGKQVNDPYGVEGSPGETRALGFLEQETTLQAEKVLSRTSGIFLPYQSKVEGYEIHMGITRSTGEKQAPLIRIESRNNKIVDDVDGTCSPDGKVWGTYLHGLFDSPYFLENFLSSLAPSYQNHEQISPSASDFKDRQYDLLARHFKQFMNMESLKKIIHI
ncbi:MAG: cobyric acid synthase [SAR324 cluster bacterium]|nr:cobyric acid synthase [SAR324 cluster bacterium]